MPRCPFKHAQRPLQTCIRASEPSGKRKRKKGTTKGETPGFSCWLRYATWLILGTLRTYSSSTSASFATIERLEAAHEEKVERATRSVASQSPAQGENLYIYTQTADTAGHQAEQIANTCTVSAWHLQRIAFASLFLSCRCSHSKCCP